MKWSNTRGLGSVGALVGAVICAMCTVVVDAANAGWSWQPPFDFTMRLTPSDEALMAALQKRVEEHDPDNDETLAILKDKHRQIESDDLKVRNLYSMGRLYSDEIGDQDAARAMWTKAYETFPEHDIGLAAMNQVLASLQSEGEFEEGLALAESVLEERDLSIEQEIHFTSRMALFYSATGEPSKGLSQLNDLAESVDWAIPGLGSILESAAAMANIHGDTPGYYATMKSIHRNIDGATDRPTFLNNIAHAAWRADRPEEAIEIFKDIVDRFPQHEAKHLLTLGNLLLETGRPDEAVEYYTRLIDLDLTEDHWERQAIASRNVESLQRRSANPSRGLSAIALLLLISTLVPALIIYYAVRSRQALGRD